MLTKQIPLIILFVFTLQTTFAQLPEVRYDAPKEYVIEDIQVSGIKYLNHSVLIQLSGLSIGQKVTIPGQEISKAVEKLWTQKLFSDVQISITKVEGEKVWLDLFMQERPRLSKFVFSGIRKGQAEEITEKLDIAPGNQITESAINQARYVIKNFFTEKGFYNTEVKMIQRPDTNYLNTMILYIDIDKKEKVKINDIVFKGNTSLSEHKLRRAMKETKQKRWYGLFKPSKYINDNYKEDLKAIVKKYRKNGFRDVAIKRDTVYYLDKNTLQIEIEINEGTKYYFRNIEWAGNTKYSSEQLAKVLRIKKGDVYNQELLNGRLNYDEDAVANIYMDDGYLFFNISPVEAAIEADSVDIELRVYEGQQARINKVTILGNTKTKDHVVRREVRTLPGDLFRKSDIIRTVRELAQLGFFDPEQIVPTPLPNPTDGTVDLEYTLVEKSNDQIELSGGWGNGMIVGSLGLRLNNFDTRDIFKKNGWKPIPSGGGQQLSIRGQTSGANYQAFSFSFIEPWLGRKKPNSFSFSLYKTLNSNGLSVGNPGRRTFEVNGAALGFGKRLKVPDDYFQIYSELKYQNYDLNNWALFDGTDISTGSFNTVALKVALSRSSISQPIYPRSGSKFALTAEITPPFSLFNNKNYTGLTDQEKYKWVEYHKWTFEAQWVSRIVGDLVLVNKTEFGYLGYYNPDIGPSLFEGFDLGGDGMGYYTYGKDIIGLRGYTNGSLTPSKGGNIYDKFTMELRYPIALKESVQVYALTFAEGGNAWYSLKDFNPLNIYRSAGVGLRIFMPMLGLLGFDYGYGFDATTNPDDSGPQFHFIFGQQF